MLVNNSSEMGVEEIIIALKVKINELGKELNGMQSIYVKLWRQSGKDELTKDKREILKKKEKEIQDLKDLINNIDDHQMNKDFSKLEKLLKEAHEIINAKGGEK